MRSNLTKEAIEFYHQLLSGGYFSSTHELLEEGTKLRKLSFSGRPTCAVLRPYFIEEGTYAYVRNASALVIQGISLLRQKLISDANLRRELDLTPEEDEIIRIGETDWNPDASARLDGFLTGEGQFHFVEYNADSPGGIAFGAELGDLFESMPVFQEFAKRYHVRSIPVRKILFQTLLKSYKNWGGKNIPNIAIVDWSGVPTYNEFLILHEYFASRGCSVRIADPSELQYRSGSLFIEDFRVDVVYKRLLVSELLAKFGLNHPLIEAVRERAVCVMNGFGVQVLCKKIIFALLSDPAYSHNFPPEIAAAISKHIPWTRKVGEKRTAYGEETVDLIPFIEENRERLVLKPSGEYGGKGVILGWESDPAAWVESLQIALNGSYVVQERVPLGQEVFPSVVDNRLHFDPRYLDIDPYVWEGNQIDGCGIRLSRAALLNVSAGGGSAVPMFVIRERERES